MRQYAAAVLAAGFTGERAAEAVAVGWAESTGDVGAVNPSSGTRGAWQIHPYWHREVGDRCAFDLFCAARQTFRISNGGRDWSQWATWPAAAAEHLPAARRAVGAPARMDVTQVSTGGDLTDALRAAPQMPAWLLGILGDKAGDVAGDVASGVARDAAIELVRAAAPALLTVALVGGGLALVLVGANAASKGTGKGANGGG